MRVPPASAERPGGARREGIWWTIRGVVDGDDQIHDTLPLDAGADLVNGPGTRVSHRYALLSTACVSTPAGVGSGHLAPSDRRNVPAASDHEDLTTVAPRGLAVDVEPEPHGALSPAQLADLLPLLDGADSVELKVGVPESNRRSTVEALEMDPLAAQLRQVTFFDTPDLSLSRHGVVVRARRVQGRDGDLVVKLRPVTPQQLGRWRGALDVEVDVMPGGFVCSATSKTKHPDATVKELFRGVARVGDLLSKQQRALYDEHAPGGVQLEDLRHLGPVNVLKLKYKPTGTARRIVAELWFYPDGARVLELSTKCAPDTAFVTAAEMRELLAARGVEVGVAQSTKTKAALEFFAAEIDDGRWPAPG